MISGKKTPGKGIVKNEVKESFSCDDCDATFLTSQSLSAHKALHLGTTNCDDCDKSFSNKWNLKIHKKKMHDVVS